MSVATKQTKTSVFQDLQCAWDRGDRIPAQLNELIQNPVQQWTKHALDTYLREREIAVNDRFEIKVALRQIGEFKVNWKSIIMSNRFVQDVLRQLARAVFNRCRTIKLFWTVNCVQRRASQPR